MATLTAPGRLRGSALSQIDGNAPGRLREKVMFSLWPVEEHEKPEVITARQPIRSLIPPVIPSGSKTEPNTIRRRRNSSSSISNKSFTSSISSRVQMTHPTLSLATMPAEILDCIFQHLPQRDLHPLMLAHPTLVGAAATFMYAQPHFASTYRYAQFAWTVSNNDSYADMVRVLDLSYFGEEGGEHGEVVPQAGWREFKYRHHDMYYVRDRMRVQALTHPPPSPYLKSFHRTRDIPLGGICHVLGSCKKIRKINLSRLQLASDFLVLSPDSSASPNSPRRQIYVSDVPKSHTWTSAEIIPLYSDTIITHLASLPNLSSLGLKSCLWLTTNRVERLVKEAWEGLAEVDLRESGMQKGIGWAVEGSRKDVERIVGEVLRNSRDNLR